MDQYLLRPEEAARVLSIGRSKLYELMAAGRLGSVTIDGCRRVRIEDIGAFVASLSPQRSPSTVEPGAEPSGVIDLRDDQPLLFPDLPSTPRRGRTAS